MTYRELLIDQIQENTIASNSTLFLVLSGSIGRVDPPNHNDREYIDHAKLSLVHRFMNTEFGVVNTEIWSRVLDSDVPAPRLDITHLAYSESGIEFDPRAFWGGRHHDWTDMTVDPSSGPDSTTTLTSLIDSLPEIYGNNGLSAVTSPYQNPQAPVGYLRNRSSTIPTTTRTMPAASTRWFDQMMANRTTT
jgi:hypothetical protein